MTDMTTLVWYGGNMKLLAPEDRQNETSLFSALYIHQKPLNLLTFFFYNYFLFFEILLKYI